MLNNELAKQSGDEFLTRRELARRWRCSEMTLKRRERERLLNAFRTGRIVRYRLAEIEKIEAAR